MDQVLHWHYRLFHPIRSLHLFNHLLSTLNTTYGIFQQLQWISPILIIKGDNYDALTYTRKPSLHSSLVPPQHDLWPVPAITMDQSNPDFRVDHYEAFLTYTRRAVFT